MERQPKEPVEEYLPDNIGGIPPEKKEQGPDGEEEIRDPFEDKDTPEDIGKLAAKHASHVLGAEVNPNEIKIE